MTINALSIRIHLALVCLLALAPPGAAAAADDARTRYFHAEKAYNELLEAPRLRKYRHHWLRVIGQFQKVYDQDPEGAWAAAGLYRTGLTYLELHRRSGRTADRDDGIARLQRVIREFPRSAYRNKARDRLEAFPGVTVASPQAPPPPKESPAARSARNRFEKAKACQARLMKNPRRTKHRDVWLACIDGFLKAHETDPQGPVAAASLYQTGALYQQLAVYSKSRADREAGERYLRRVMQDHAGSPYAPMARALLGEGRPDDSAVADAASPGAGPAGAGEASAFHAVSGLRYWSNPSYTRVVVDTSGKTPYFHHLLKKDPDLGKPQRLYVDLQNARLAKDFPKVVPINDDLLLDARAGQYQKDTVRVVVDIKSFKTYKIFSLMNPFRIVIDVWGEGGASPPADQPPASVKLPDGKIPPGSIARSLALGVSRIVVDAGHGGKDPGALGACRSAREKDITLSMARRLKKKLEARLGANVILTRDGDTFLTLEERTAMANTEEADLFISLHVNAHRDRGAYGIETYFLNLATDEDSIRVAAMENATSTKNISDLQTILMDLMQNAKINESSRLAGYVQASMVGHLQKHYGRVRDKGVKQAPFYVLLGAQMPAILVETSFISNPRECKRLMDPVYQDRICEGIMKGIENYINATRATALQAGPNPHRRNG